MINDRHLRIKTILCEVEKFPPSHYREVIVLGRGGCGDVYPGEESKEPGGNFERISRRKLSSAINSTVDVQINNYASYGPRPSQFPRCRWERRESTARKKLVKFYEGSEEGAEGLVTWPKVILSCRYMADSTPTAPQFVKTTLRCRLQDSKFVLR